MARSDRTGVSMQAGRARRLLIGAGAALLALVVFGVYVVSRIEPSDYVALVNASVKERTGRELRIGGRIGMSLSLVPTVTAEDISFQNASWGSRPDMLRAKRIEVGIALLPLLSGTVELRAIELVEPDLLLETDGDGRPNWAFESADAQPKPPASGAGSRAVGIRSLRVVKGVLSHRDGETGRETRLLVDALEMARDGHGIDIKANASMNAVPLQLTGTIKQSGAGSPADVDMMLSTRGARLSAKGTAHFGAPGGSAPNVAFSLEASDWAAIAQLAQTQPMRLPPLKATGSLRWDAEAFSFERLSVSLGKSDASGSVRIGRSDTARLIDARLDAGRVDLAELLGPPQKRAVTDHRLFSAEPFALDTLKSLDGKADLRIGRVVLRDGKPLDGLELAATFKGGKVRADPVRVRFDGKELRVRVEADGSSGKSLALEVAADSNGISLDALLSLLNLPGAVEGGPTDISVRLGGRGNSVRTLMADASGDVRIVVGPGRLRGRGAEFGADVTELLNALNPARATDPHTELRCAVIRLPIRRGVVRVENSIAMETAKVNVIAAGVIDLRNETLDLGFRPKAATGLGVGLGRLANLGRLKGSFADPKVEVDFGGAATTATQLGLAAATGGLSLLAGGLLSESVPDNPCQAALTGAIRAPAKRDASKPSVIDGVINNVKKLFGG